MIHDQVVRIPSRAIAFTAVCDACVDLDSIAGWSGSSFAGRLELDVDHGTFLCRRGHAVRVDRDLDRRREHGVAAA
jgi:hypothetical protein